MRLGLILLLSSLLCACVSWEEAKPWFVPVEEAEADKWQLHQQRVLPLRSWSLTGRMALQSGDQGWNASLSWDQQSESYQLRFIAPFGQGTWELRGAADAVLMTTNENQQLQADSAEQLLQEQLGWSVPLDGLRYWARGIPNPQQPVARLNTNANGQMLDLDQQGWRISVLRYQQVDGIALPGKLFLANERFQLRLIIQNWDLKQG